MPGNFEFIGFEPTDDLKTFTKQIFWLVEDKAPSQSAKSAALTKIDKYFQARIKISSSSGIFEMDATNEDPKACIEQVYLKAKATLKDWARNRNSGVNQPEIA